MTSPLARETAGQMTAWAKKKTRPDERGALLRTVLKNSRYSL